MISFLEKTAGKAFFCALFLLSLFAFFGCSSSDDDSASVPLATPNNLALTAKSGILTVQFSRIDGIGAEGSQNGPSYEVSIATDEVGSDRKVLGEVPAVTSNLVRFNIVNSPDGTEVGTVFTYPSLTDGLQYWIFVRTNFATSGYGFSDYAKLSAVPIPLPAPVTNPKVERGDKRIVVSWYARAYEEYSVQEDCPKNNTNHLNPGFWDLVNLTSGNNYVFTLDDNTGNHKFCIASTNVNGNGEWYIFGDTSTSPITYDQYAGIAATDTPDAPEVTIVKNAGKRVDISFPAVLTGSKSVSDYQYSYKESGSSTWSIWEPILISSLTGGVAGASISGLENGKTYDIKVRALNTVETAGAESDIVTGYPVYIPLNFNNPDEYLSKANAEYIYAEDVPHSDFWRISSSLKQGGRPATDRLVRGKETALGNLYADALQWYAIENNYNTDFAWLIGDIINNGIQRSQTITPKFLSGITNQDFIDDTVVIVTVKGSNLISDPDYALDLDNYPTVGIEGNGYAATLFGQAAAVYRNGHYGGSGGTTYNGVYWGIPSKEVRYTIEYKPYSLEDFNDNFNGKPACVNARNANNGAYNSVTDPDGCYLLSYNKASPVSGSPEEGSVMGYKRGRIKAGSLTINSAAIDPDADYTIATTKRIADSHYLAFLGSDYNDTGVTLLRAVAEYIFNNGSAGMTPYLDGRVKIEGGVPGDSKSDFKQP
ncbi:MAG: hypothetical protein LBD73_05995 [Deferribacteraceae bacterium]|jgi:hypothetical protein|nr:hypothetical protein [Deferribacteraceae bacterium]